MISALKYSPQMQCFGAQVRSQWRPKPRGCDRLGQECHSLVDCTAVHPLHPVRRASQAESVSPPDGCRIDRLGGVCETPPMQCFVWRHCQLLGSEARCGTPSSCYSVESAVLCALIRTSVAWHRPSSPTAAFTLSAMLSGHRSKRGSPQLSCYCRCVAWCSPCAVALKRTATRSEPWSHARYFRCKAHPSGSAKATSGCCGGCVSWRSPCLQYSHSSFCSMR